jgi:hypothetical protein
MTGDGAGAETAGTRETPRSGPSGMGPRAMAILPESLAERKLALRSEGAG